MMQSHAPQPIAGDRRRSTHLPGMREVRAFTAGFVVPWLRRGLLRLCQLVLGPLLVLCWLEARRGRSERWFAACAECLSLMPGQPGSWMRKAFYRATIRDCAERAYLSFGALLVTRAAAVGADVYIGPYSVIGTAIIEDGVKIASRVSITSGRHQHGSTAPAVEAAPRRAAVVIGEGSWIGEGAIVMADIGRRCIVGAGSVVVHPVAAGTVVAGNPARPIRSSSEVAPLRHESSR